MIEIGDWCKGVQYGDLGESFHRSIYLQNVASIQPRTSLVKFARSLAMQPGSGAAALAGEVRGALRPRNERLGAACTDADGAGGLLGGGARIS